MKILKYLLVIVVVIVAAALLAALFIKQDLVVEKTVEINKPVDSVFNYIKYLKNQNEYSVWAKIDPKMEKTFTGTDGRIGFISGWKSDNKDAGIGEQEIKKIDESKRIDIEIRFKEPFESISPAYMTTAASGANSTKVAWGFKTHMAYPMNLLIPLTGMEKSIENDLQTGLNNLKELLEK